MPLSKSEFRDKIGGVLLGTALGDALGFIAEGMDSDHIMRRFGQIKRFHLLGARGFVTDDTEQTALVAFSLARNADNIQGFLADFRRSLVLWYFCLPFGIGRATKQACTRIALGITDSGIKSAGNGAAMRAAIIGAFFFDAPQTSREFGTKLAQVTHSDQRAIQGALFVAELATVLMNRTEGQTLLDCFAQALELVTDTTLQSALSRAAQMAQTGEDAGTASSTLNGRPGGFILNSLPFSTFCFLRGGDGDVLDCISQTICGGGDTDTNAAIVGAWLGALKGESALPDTIISKIDNGPFGPKHLRQLADALVAAKFEGKGQAPGYALPHCALRNIFLMPVIIGHALLRLRYNLAAR